MKKIFLLAALATAFFLIGYSQNRLVPEKRVLIQAEDEIVIKTGQASIILKKDGSIQIKGSDIKITGSGDVILKGKKVLQN
ncbi:MAG TPA: hypothetical protein PKC72_10825 [Chitinophagaceae bacterium]|nr:hypothetical protein [Chitinophagaceae bacterium]